MSADIGLADAFIDGDISFPGGSSDILRFLGVVIANKKRAIVPGMKPLHSRYAADGWRQPSIHLDE